MKVEKLKIVKLSYPEGQQQKNTLCNVILLWYKMESFERDIAKHGVKVSKMEGTGVEGAHQ